MRKDDVETHSLHYYGPKLPAVNVKHYGSFYGDEVQERFGCTEEVAERALRWQSYSSCETFWEDIQELAKQCFGDGVEVYPAGRIGGWAVVEGLPDLKDWDAVQLGRWAKFAKMCCREAAYRTSLDVIMEDIDANRWAEENSEEYNYIDKGDGETVCLADVPRCAHCIQRS